MVKTKKPTGRAASIPGGLASGALVNILITLMLTAVIAKMVQSGLLSQDQIGYGIMFLLFFSSVAGAMTAQSRVKHRRMLVSLLSGLIYIVILLSVTALFFGGQYAGFGVTVLLIMGGTGTVAILSGSRGGRPHKKSIRGLR